MSFDRIFLEDSEQLIRDPIYVKKYRSFHFMSYLNYRLNRTKLLLKKRKNAKITRPWRFSVKRMIRLKTTRNKALLVNRIEDVPLNAGMSPRKAVERNSVLIFNFGKKKELIYSIRYINILYFESFLKRCKLILTTYDINKRLTFFFKYSHEFDLHVINSSLRKIIPLYYKSFQFLVSSEKYFLRSKLRVIRNYNNLGIFEKFKPVFYSNTGLVSVFCVVPFGFWFRFSKERVLNIVKYKKKKLINFKSIFKRRRHERFNYTYFIR